ncbi:hypothetical protein JAAARDRAFT_61450 [Jaapia argillacea MUCL 33604]|uniref:Uncharacterized protein n=1 Tax=Jaapia argillacea MUCL 33604 TaxID=933084 RepID=A0A067PPC9_9AGAM|nr:hypothetical protein JAAARDRAFT_61450 [Jaapia argillacea MUCL 33604]
MDPTASSETYASQLSTLRHGHALWQPDVPRVSGGDALSPPVRIGDVGYLRYGGFHTLFNVLLPSDHASQRWGTPPDFRQLEVPGTDGLTPQQVLDFVTSSKSSLGPGVLKSSGSYSYIRPDELATSVTRQQTASVTTSNQVLQEDTNLLPLFQQYMIQHYKSWLEWANEDNGFGIDLSDFYFVTGCDKSVEWEVTTSSSIREDQESHGTVDMTGYENSTAVITSSTTWTPSVDRRRGPYRISPPVPGELPIEPVYNQCLFIRGFRMMDRSLPEEYGDEDVIIEMIPDDCKSINLLAPILEYVLRDSSLEVAIAHDQDIFPFSEDAPNPLKVMSNLDELRPGINVVDGVGRIEIPASLQEAVAGPVQPEAPGNAGSTPPILTVD